ncbi:hypothetical protein B0A50_02113 [Salinomyces thailandicus]|uniref:Uncharacterized protein n=1 Tax=Salinomyces thailandicus TaxID=706561 RepID=A0A4U0U7V9_9PEZI|nr:hypothetical protein B0A50_02113 [Salinomyces thailandica]
MHINTSDVLAHPLCNANFLSNDYDLRAQIVFAKYIRRIAQKSPFADVWDAEYEPGLDVVRADEELGDY